ncbi:dihydrofolate reductase-like domain-containing protein [Dactylonectria estremocensis]|uniref:Dihydrofolate reductase n=1 Tax=Dactylonectria estremocensis TaxID=1079267 RepID=A0A9P9JEC3_9HYPO|nr:dihydrofolate reductase-like domain-containing protein [Dactylonectria estremocensis]
MQALELTLIVAATRNMGIGANGTMPWTGLRKEMQYFARVTTRIPQGAPSTAINAVIMGRKTWDSIPSKFRPLKDRLNIVITRSAPALVDPDTGAASEAAGAGAGAEAVKVNSLEAALQLVRARADVGRVFVMGGAQIYDAALKLDEARRVLLTSIDREFDCDAFFPLRLGDGGNTNWIKRPREALEQWTGQEVVEGGQEEAGTQYEFQMWEKDSP